MEKFGYTPDMELESKLPQVQISEEAYLNQSLENLKLTSKTAQEGSVRLRSSGKEVFVWDLNKDAKEKTASNFSDCIKLLYQHKDSRIDRQEDLKNLIRTTYITLNNELVGDELFLREDDSEKYDFYSPAVVLPEKYDRFVDNFLEQLQTDKDPVELAAWAEYNIDCTHHFFADGCGRMAKLMAAFVCMRKNHPLPSYPKREDYYSSNLHAIHNKPTGEESFDQMAWQTWLENYRRYFE